MEIQPSFSQNVRSLAQSEDKKANGPMGQQVSDMAHAKNAEKATQSSKQQLNAALLENTLDISVNAGDEPLSLVLKAAIEGINEALAETHGENAIQTAYDSGLDVSPEATAERIVSLSTGFFEPYLEQHPEMDESEAREAFAEIIRGGIEQGFGEARDILSGLDVLEGDIATNIDRTYELVMEGLAAFIDGTTGQAAE